MKNLTFQGYQLSLVNHTDEIWFRSAQIGEALGYQNGQKKIHDLYTRNADEFTSQMTAVIKLPDLHPQFGDTGQLRDTRIFSLRGAHLLAMLARTQKAKEFRKWVLDLLDNYRDNTSKEERARLRHESAAGYKLLSHSLQQSRLELGKPTAKHNYMNEAKLLNSFIAGQFKGVNRDSLSKSQLDLLSKLQLQDAFLLARGVTDYHERKQALTQYYQELNTPKLTSQGVNHAL